MSKPELLIDILKRKRPQVLCDGEEKKDTESKKKEQIEEKDLQYVYL